MPKIVVISAKFGIAVKELDIANYQDGAVLIRDLLQAIPDADWFEEKPGKIRTSQQSSYIEHGV
jgi:predicted Zn-dependent protease